MRSILHRSVETAGNTKAVSFSRSRPVGFTLTGNNPRLSCLSFNFVALDLLGPLLNDRYGVQLFIIIIGVMA